MIIAQISDTHMTLDESPDGAATRVQRAVAHLLELAARPDVVIITGDCAHNGQRAEYTRLQELLRPLPMPVYVVPGNHDNRALLLELFGTQGAQPLVSFMQYVVEAGPLLLIALDTNVPGSGHGHLDAQRLEWLDQRLSEAPARPTLVFMHHPPIRIGLTPFDQIGLEGADALGAIIARHPQVERIVAGHVHMALVRRFAGSLVMTCPTTTLTLLPDVNRPERVSVQMQPPACLIHVWQASTELITYTSLIGAHGPAVDMHNGERWV